jgi:cobyrinic acid a,c-diamide synthase
MKIDLNCDMGEDIGNLWATYVHTHFLNAPHIAARFVSVCLEVKNGRLRNPSYD